MGIGEILGVRTIKISTSSSYSLEEFFEKIKDTPFDAGKPALVKDGLTYVIAFPQIDRNNQVQIIGNKGLFYVQRSIQPAGIDKMVANMALEKLTDGLTGLSGAFGSAKKKCMELAQNTADIILAMNL